jgi:PEP-CTERM motif
MTAEIETVVGVFVHGRARLRESAMKRANRMVGASAIGAAMLIGLCTSSARAAFVVDLTQEGSNVVATGSGTINLTDLRFDFSIQSRGVMFPANGAIVNGPRSFTLESVYTGITGPTNFGGGGSTRASSGSGDIVSISGAARLVDVPAFYLSGTALSDSMTFDSATFASLGATPGTYKWTWGSGVNADSFTLQIGPASVIPEPSTWAMMLLGFAGLGLAGWRRRRTACNV